MSALAAPVSFCCRPRRLCRGGLRHGGACRRCRPCRRGRPSGPVHWKPSTPRRCPACRSVTATGPSRLPRTSTPRRPAARPQACCGSSPARAAAGASRGSFNGDQTMPTSYVATIDYDHSKIDDVRMALAGGNVKDLSADPPLVPASRSHSGERRRPPRRRRSDELDNQPRRRQRRSGVAFSLRPQGRGVRRPRALRPAQRVQAHREGQGGTRLPGAGRGLRGVFRADLRLRAGAGR